MVLPALKRNPAGRLLFSKFHLSHKPGLFSGAPMPKPVSHAMLPAAGPATPCDRQLRRWKSHLANGSSHFSDGKIVWQICKPPHKLAKPFFRRKSRSAHGSSRSSGGKVTWHICRMTGLASETLKNTLK
jgi:hypothetical protein